MQTAVLLAALQGGAHEHAQVVHRAPLTDVLLERTGPQGRLDAVILVDRVGGQDRSVRVFHVAILAAGDPSRRAAVVTGTSDLGELSQSGAQQFLETEFLASALRPGGGHGLVCFAGPVAESQQSAD